MRLLWATFLWKSERLLFLTTMYLAGWIDKVCLFHVDCGTVGCCSFCCFRTTIFCSDQMDICHVSFSIFEMDWQLWVACFVFFVIVWQSGGGSEVAGSPNHHSPKLCYKCMV